MAKQKNKYSTSLRDKNDCDSILNKQRFKTKMKSIVMGIGTQH